MIDIKKEIEIDYDNGGNGGFDEWYTFHGDNKFYMKIHGSIVDLIENNFEESEIHNKKFRLTLKIENIGDKNEKK